MAQVRHQLRWFELAPGSVGFEPGRPSHRENNRSGVLLHQVDSARTRCYADPMDDEQEPKPSYKHYSSMPLWAKLALIAAVIAVGIIYFNFVQ